MRTVEAMATVPVASGTGGSAGKPTPVDSTIIRADSKACRAGEQRLWNKRLHSSRGEQADDRAIGPMVERRRRLATADW